MHYNFITGGESGILLSVDTRNFKKLSTMGYKHKNSITDIIFSEDGSRLCSASADSSIFVADIESGRLVYRFLHAHDGTVECLTTMNSNPGMV